MSTESAMRALADLSEVDIRLSASQALPRGEAPALKNRRTTLRNALPSSVLEAYDTLGRAGRHPAVVPLVRDTHCGGCYMRVPPQLTSFVRRGQSVACPHCRRLLFAADPVSGNEHAIDRTNEPVRRTTRRRTARQP